MKISKQAKREAKEWFRTCFANGVLEENRVRETVQRILRAKPRGLLAILAHFERLVRLELTRRTARVETAVPLEADLEAQVRAALARVYGAGLQYSFTQNPSLIGGMRIKVGSDVYDGSIQGRLAALEERFLA